MNPIPIAIVMRSFDPGGTERQMIELVSRLDPGRWLRYIVCFRAEGGWFSRVVDSGATIVEFPVRSFRRPAVIEHVGAFTRWCRETRIAVVQATELPSNLFALPAAALARVPVRLGARREINPNKTPAEIAMQRAAYTCATRIVANSRAAANRLRLERVPAKKIAVVPNGLDPPLCVVRRPQRTLRTIVVVANLRPEKRHDLLIDCAPLVIRQFPDVEFLIVGDGPERTRLEARAAERGVLGWFRFLGHQQHVAGQLAGADIFVLPSESEGFPNAVLEAMAAGLPVVAFDIEALREIVEPGRTGLLVPFGDVAALADALCRLMSRPELGAEMGMAAQVAARAGYSFERMVDAFESLYMDGLFPHRSRIAT